jgi:hypothetical protein
MRKSTTSRLLEHRSAGHAQRAEGFETARGEDTQTDTQSTDAETTSGTNDALKFLN